MARAVITGGAGFIGAALCAKLLRDGGEVVCLDLLRHGPGRVRDFLSNPRFQLVQGDVADPAVLAGAVREAESVYHLAADPEVRSALADPVDHVTANSILTLRVLEAMRTADAKKIAFASSSTVYGEPTMFPTPETAPIAPIGLYGATKAASEAMIASYCHSYGMGGVPLRFANVVGPGLTHGVIYDFVAKLQKNPRVLEVLGDGTQSKSYVHVEDCAEAAVHLLARTRGFDPFNVGTEDMTSVREIAGIVIRELALSKVEIRFAGGPQGRGWPGDVKRMLLDARKARAAGWKPRRTSVQAVEEAARAAVRNQA